MWRLIAVGVVMVMGGVIGALAGATRADVVIPLGQDVFDGAGVRPGAVVGIEPGERDVLRITGLRGSAAQPIVVINAGGLVRIANSDRGFALAIQGCEHVRVTGSGSADHRYGIQAEATREGMFAVHINGRSRHIEVERIEVTGAGFGGFNVKDEPKLDGSTNRDSFEMVGINLHHNYVHDVEGEGFYIGHTFYHGWTHPQTKRVLLPHVMRDVRVAHNLIENVGCEGIQVGSSVGGLEVVDNVIINPGQRPFARWQDNGMQINSCGDALIARNRIIGAPGNGIIAAVLDQQHQLVIARNEVSRVGGYGVYLGGQHGSEADVAVVHNALAHAAKGAFRNGNRSIPRVVTANNLAIACGGAALPTDSGNQTMAAASITIDETARIELEPQQRQQGHGVALPERLQVADRSGRQPHTQRPTVGALASAGTTAEASARGDTGINNVQAAARRRAAGGSRQAAATAVRTDAWWQALGEAIDGHLQAGGALAVTGRRLPGTGLSVVAIERQRVTLSGDGVRMRVPLQRLGDDAVTGLVAALGERAP